MCEFLVLTLSLCCGLSLVLAYCAKQQPFPLTRSESKNSTVLCKRACAKQDTGDVCYVEFLQSLQSTVCCWCMKGQKWLHSNAALAALIQLCKANCRFSDCLWVVFMLAGLYERYYRQWKSLGGKISGSVVWYHTITVATMLDVSTAFLETCVHCVPASSCLILMSAFWPFQCGASCLRDHQYCDIWNLASACHGQHQSWFTWFRNLCFGFGNESKFWGVVITHTCPTCVDATIIYVILVYSKYHVIAYLRFIRETEFGTKSQMHLTHWHFVNHITGINNLSDGWPLSE